MPVYTRQSCRNQTCRGDGAQLVPHDYGPESGGKVSTAAKQTVVLDRHPLASRANVILAVGVALAYFFTARLSLALLEPVDGVAVFWPAA